VDVFGKMSDLGRVDRAFRAYAGDVVRHGITSEECRKLSGLFSCCVDREDASIEDMSELLELCRSAPKGR
jgi:hypothetical protein